MKADFSGYVTRYDVLCSDGVTIKPGAFAHHDGQTIPVVWQHSHNSPENVLGHTVLEHRNDGVYGRVFLNSSPITSNRISLSMLSVPSILISESLIIVSSSLLAMNLPFNSLATS